MFFFHFVTYLQENRMIKGRSNSCVILKRNSQTTHLIFVWHWYNTADLAPARILTTTWAYSNLCMIFQVLKWKDKINYHGTQFFFENFQIMLLTWNFATIIKYLQNTYLYIWNKITLRNNWDWKCSNAKNALICCFIVNKAYVIHQLGRSRG